MKFVQLSTKEIRFLFFSFFSVFFIREQIEINFEIEVFNKDHCH